MEIADEQRVLAPASPDEPDCDDVEPAMRDQHRDDLIAVQKRQFGAAQGCDPTPRSALSADDRSAGIA
jgi:hypothetical protein